MDPGPVRPADKLFPERRHAILANRCMPSHLGGCGGAVDPFSFRKGASLREYLISGYCQACQDRIFEETESAGPEGLEAAEAIYDRTEAERRRD